MNLKFIEARSILAQSHTVSPFELTLKHCSILICQGWIQVDTQYSFQELFEHTTFPQELNFNISREEVGVSTFKTSKDIFTLMKLK